YGVERDLVRPVPGADVSVRFSAGRLYSVRKDESRATGKWRSTALARRAIPVTRRIRAGPRRGRALGGEKRLPASGRCRRHDQTSRREQCPSVGDTSMKTLRFAAVCSLGLLALATPARAQAPFVNMIDHLHLAAPD